MSKITDTQLIKHLSHIDELLYSTNDDRKQLLKFCNQIINAIEKQTHEIFREGKNKITKDIKPVPKIRK